jgi:hypothetical protein
LVLGENESTPEEIVKKKKNQMFLVVSPEMNNLRYISQSDHANVFSQELNKAEKI